MYLIYRADAFAQNWAENSQIIQHLGLQVTFVQEQVQVKMLWSRAFQNSFIIIGQLSDNYGLVLIEQMAASTLPV